ncbi:variable surface protein [Plasmodium gonderi]|uniref:Variable surface protein n=1 Tax=Plasmodium gonderi TaxID=77519 RepID=A0A1Y1JNF4_PLAGO|nr:variable surface protein [Plasmodium gonderi]GAW84019.1 variable surface protein [Plasmodium gonderi]
MYVSICIKIIIYSYTFNDIFPTCMKVFDNLDGMEKRELRISYHNLCLNISDEVVKTRYFYTFCLNLCVYLDNIESENLDKKTHCKYFNYKLKYALEGLSPHCKNEQKCYEDMYQVSIGDNKKVSEVCKGDILELKEGTFKIMDILNALYTSFEYLKTSSRYDLDQSMCLHADEYSAKYKNLLQISSEINNDSLKELLENFNKEYITLQEKFINCHAHSKSIHNSSWKIAVGLILTITLLIIAFILYKYTHYVSLLQPLVRKLRSIWNNRNEEEPKLYNLMKREHKNINDKNYQILYNSVN